MAAPARREKLSDEAIQRFLATKEVVVLATVEPDGAPLAMPMWFLADGDSIVIEPFRSRSFPVVRDLIVDRGAFDRIVGRGGFITAPTGSAPDANEIPVPKEDADLAFDASKIFE